MSSQSAAAYFTPTGPVDPELKCNNYTLKATRGDEEEAKRRKRGGKGGKRRKRGGERKTEKVRD